ncbi:MAG: hypothetical protein GXO22_03360 [Aquificae bacterium]|nr:hypothetical protein [Aquificota bacterium]
MNIIGIDYREEKDFILYAKVNPFKKSVSLLEKPPKNSQMVVSIPSYLSTFRVYKFPIKDKEKIKNLIKGQLQFDLPVSFEEIDYSYYVHNDGRVFCVITKKEILNAVLKKYENVNIVDSEVFSLIRLLNFKGEKDGKIIHFFGENTVFVRINDNFPEDVHIIKENYKEYIDEDTYLSGDVPQEYKSHKKILNFNIDPKFNVAYGNILRGIYTNGVDFLHKEQLNVISIFTKLILALIVAFAVIDISLLVSNALLQKQIEEVKNKQKEIYIKYFSPSGTVYDPITQAKGLIAKAKTSKSSTESLLDILEHIAKAKMEAGIEEIYKINLEKNGFSIQGVANSLKDIEKFKNELSKYYIVTIEETVVNAEGKIRFKIKGEK